jgi:hypothetical protein
LGAILIASKASSSAPQIFPRVSLALDLHNHHKTSLKC